MKGKITNLFIGRPKQFKKPGLNSSMNRDEVQKIEVNQDSLLGDEVSNKKYHGGDNRVIHFFPNEHYHFFKSTFLKDIFFPGTIGENITTLNLDETNVHIGDIFQIGTVLCQITEPRFPCGLIDLQYDVKGMNKECLFSRKLGWFAKVLQTGTITPQDEIILSERVFPNLSLDQCILAINEDNQEETLSEMISNPILSDSWKNKAKKKIEFLKS
jgi:MOSC domain-containing protein YiiM